MVNSQRGAQRRVDYNHLISNKREWNNCFIKNADKTSLNLPDLILLEQTGKDTDFRYSHVTRLSKLSTRLDWMNEKSKH